MTKSEFKKKYHPTVVSWKGTLETAEEFMAWVDFLSTLRKLKEGKSKTTTKKKNNKP